MIEPKMTKYSDIVITGGIRVCGQMRTMRVTSLIRMVL